MVKRPQGRDVVKGAVLMAVLFSLIGVMFAFGLEGHEINLTGLFSCYDDALDGLTCRFG